MSVPPPSLALPVGTNGDVTAEREEEGGSAVQVGFFVQCVSCDLALHPRGEVGEVKGPPDVPQSPSDPSVPDPLPTTRVP